jgi:hypothetical protein
MLEGLNVTCVNVHGDPCSKGKILSYDKKYCTILDQCWITNGSTIPITSMPNPRPWWCIDFGSDVFAELWRNFIEKNK